MFGRVKIEQNDLESYHVMNQIVKTCCSKLIEDIIPAFNSQIKASLEVGGRRTCRQHDENDEGRHEGHHQDELRARESERTSAKPKTNKIFE